MSALLDSSRFVDFLKDCNEALDKLAVRNRWTLEKYTCQWIKEKNALRKMINRTLKNVEVRHSKSGDSYIRIATDKGR